MKIRKVIGYLMLIMVALMPLIIASIVYSFKEVIGLYVIAVFIVGAMKVGADLIIN